jgi:hypothetical protein
MDELARNAVRVTWIVAFFALLRERLAKAAPDASRCAWGGKVLPSSLRSYAGLASWDLCD